jgi:hypothetical protein
MLCVGERRILVDIKNKAALEQVARELGFDPTPKLMAVLHQAFLLGSQQSVGAAGFYSKDQARVADYIVSKAGNFIGAGDDPVGFLIASHDWLSSQLLHHGPRGLDQQLWEACTELVNATCDQELAAALAQIQSLVQPTLTA